MSSNHTGSVSELWLLQTGKNKNFTKLLEAGCIHTLCRIQTEFIFFKSAQYAPSPNKDKEDNLYSTSPIYMLICALRNAYAYKIKSGRQIIQGGMGKRV